VEGEDHRYRSLTVGEHLLNVIGKRLGGVHERRSHATPRSTTKSPDPTTILDRLDLTKTVTPKQYDRELEEYQGQLNVLSRKAKKEGVSTIIVSEGWDAAGKGGLIRRITGALDARSYSVIPIAAPTDEEKAHHYLWRFWRRLPRAGRFTIYDRSWYGRVLVERVESFAQEAEWMRAYAEINDFEEQLAEHGIAIVKWWVHIGKDEQLKRFKAREQTAYKKFKITDEDYRNREKWNAYEAAANEMIERTSTEFAPWTLIEGNDKHYARLKGLKTVVKALERVL
jgi:polyphosphate kinase 2 (PPK2 family)